MLIVILVAGNVDYFCMLVLHKHSTGMTVAKTVYANKFTNTMVIMCMFLTI